MRFLWIFPVTLLLGGCVLAIPPAITIASYAADGISLLLSGKSVSDHAISEIADQDCAMWRIIRLENPCRDYEDGDGEAAVQTAQTEPASDESATVQVAAAVDRPVDAGSGPDYGGGEDDGAGPDLIVSWTGPEMEPGVRIVESFGGEEEGAAANAQPAWSNPALEAKKPTVSAAARRQPIAGLRAVEPSAAAARTSEIAPAPRVAAPRVAVRAEPVARPKTIAAAPANPAKIVAAKSSIVPPAQVAAAASDGPEFDVDGPAFVVLGSFADPANAGCLARSQAEFGAGVVAVKMRGMIWYRVATTGRTRREADVLRRQFVAAGYPGAWVAEPCGGLGADGNCLPAAPTPVAAGSADCKIPSTARAPLAVPQVAEAPVVRALGGRALERPARRPRSVLR